MKKIDTIILGGGPGGYHAALLLRKCGIDVAIIERDKVGGTCLHEGCIPTKSLLYSAKQCGNVIDIEDISNKKINDVNKLYKGLCYQLQSNKVSVINGTGKLCYDEVGNIVVSVDDEKIHFNNLILATGSRNIIVNIPGLEDAVKTGNAVYSDDFLNLKAIPSNVAIIGAGVIGLEFASFLSMMGKRVTVIEGRNEILNGMLDEDCEVLYRKELDKLGIDIITGALIEEIEDSNVVYKLEEDYYERSFDLIVVACGRRANIDDAGLVDVGIDIEDDVVLVNENCQTNISNIYACGDLIGGSMLAHAAYMEAEIIVDNISCRERNNTDYVIPSVVYTNPEVAIVGKSETFCNKNNIQHYVKKESMLYSGRYLIEHGDFPGICKLIFSKDGVIIGAQMIGNSSSETIFALSDMIQNKVTNEEIINKCYPHPSFVEIIKDVASK